MPLIMSEHSHYLSGLAYAFACALILVTAYYFVLQHARARIQFVSVVCLTLGLLVCFKLYRYPWKQDGAWFQSALNVQLWLRDNTQKGELVFFPPIANVWSGISERGDWFNYAQVGYIIYVPSVLAEVKSRLQEYGVDWLSLQGKHSLKNEMIEKFQKMDLQRIKEISEKYDIRYLVTAKTAKAASRCAVAYQNNFFTVCDIPSS